MLFPLSRKILPTPVHHQQVKIIPVKEEILLEINGKKVRLKDFPMRALKGTILGFIKSLNLEEEPKEINIKIKLDGEDSGDS